jgi:hypothetical protein
VACASNALYTSTNSGITWKDVGLSAPYTGVTASADGMALAACIGGGGICTYNCTGRIIAPSTTVGTTGYVSGGRNCAIELQYIGGDTFVPISHEGSLGAN